MLFRQMQSHPQGCGSMFDCMQAWWKHSNIGLANDWEERGGEGGRGGERGGGSPIASPSHEMTFIQQLNPHTASTIYLPAE